MEVEFEEMNEKYGEEISEDLKKACTTLSAFHSLIEDSHFEETEEIDPLLNEEFELTFDIGRSELSSISTENGRFKITCKRVPTEGEL